MAVKPSNALRGLPSVEALAQTLEGPRGVAVAAARAVIDDRRREILAGAATGAEGLEPAATARMVELQRASPRRVLNATGVILHTNLGRAPLAPVAAAAAAEAASGYCDLELDLATGERGSRHSHVEELLIALSGAEAAMAVNNNAAAVLLALASSAGGREVILGRDQLLEIGGSFRIPEILAQSGATLVEVGTTNRTRAADYAAAIGPATGALMRVHRSNFTMEGFTETPGLDELCELGRERGLTVIDDLGSGALEPIENEPLLRESIAAGADIVCCSADKLLGGPQAGIIAGRAEAVARCRAHPLARALRLDKLQLAALGATLRLHRDGEAHSIPALAMLHASREQLERRVAALVEAAGPSARIAQSTGRPGGGTMPVTKLPGPVCALDPGRLGADGLIAALRGDDPPVIARIEDGSVLLDPRTLSDEEAEEAGRAVRRALG